GDEKRTIVRQATDKAFDGESVYASFLAEAEKSVEVARQRNSVRLAAVRPIADVLARDGNARAALEEIAKRRRDEVLSPAYKAPFLRPASGSGSVPDLSNLDPGLNFFFPPYDYQRVAPVVGFTDGWDYADQFSGNFELWRLGGGADGRVFASAGIGF